MVNAREPLLQHTFGFVDGKNFRRMATLSSGHWHDLLRCRRMHHLVEAQLPRVLEGFKNTAGISNEAH
ncbi:uncharacterized protein PITG_01595 [Phytophthora infestans T30-4]|uniref:Uncharacterized protein n=1 Tax=Phytophthora infestans (strain T30-4) TaxID=403677 RepID=D0MTL8_PHYIT|nr:uncharacterized protein PITG_01595 [Phytophthora infestans T30-4]EEY61315.1 hypothetical protein PITG_01595 [Phytophthora infestans T30-4]|eukprot:XP_002908232.1 hypothetical protein PITG_01595 [Phytophthora infestans T30-4]